MSTSKIELFGMKIHDYHVLMQHLLSVAIRCLLPKHVCFSFIYMSNTFRVLCSKELNFSDLKMMEKQLLFIMSNLERIFPLAFFNVIVHLLVHLVEEAKLGGHVQYC